MSFEVSGFKMKKLGKLFFAQLLLAAVVVPASHAVPLNQATSVIPGGFTAPTPPGEPSFLQQVTAQLQNAVALSFGAFTGGLGGSIFSAQLLGTATGYDGNHGYGTDVFGLLDNNNQFTALIGANAALGTTASIAQGQNQEYRLALNSPAGLFTSINSNNADGAYHLIGLQVTQDQSLTLIGIPGLSTYSVKAGDFILFLDDQLFASRNPHEGDFNDMVLRIRSGSSGGAAVPEPATLLLSSIGAGAFLKRRKNRALC